MTKLSIKAKASILVNAEVLGYECGKAEDVLAQAIALLQEHSHDAQFRSLIEEKLRLGRMRWDLSKRANREFTPEEVQKIRNLDKNDRTETEKDIYSAANQWLYNLRKRNGIAKSTKTGRKKGSTNQPKLATANPKAGSTLTPTVKGREDFAKTIRGMAATMYAFHEKNKDIPNCDDLHTFCINTWKTASLLK